ncbi:MULTISPECIES: hypothetical protein [unclassified Streptomyces]|uniref:hypothetical protein n=1 Tax=unclassified Streptomyces TaxID=2593676 RepID=UPI0036E96699
MTAGRRQPYGHPDTTNSSPHESHSRNTFPRAIAPEVDFLPAGVRLEGMEAATFLSKDGYTYVLYGERADGKPYTVYMKGGVGDIGYYSGVLAEGDDARDPGSGRRR